MQVILSWAGTALFLPVFGANHQNMFDIAIVGALLFWSFPKYVSKRELGRWIGVAATR